MLKLKNTKLNLDDLVDSANIADMIDPDDLQQIAYEVHRMAEFDRNSRYDWEMMADEVVSLARLESVPKHTPFENASNVKLPLMSTAALQFAASAVAEVIKNGEVVHFAVAGADPDNSAHQVGQGIQDHMNYQLLVESDEFPKVLDKLVHTYSLVGIMFTKVYYNKIKQRVTIELIPYKDLYIHGDTTSLEDARRITHVIKMYPNDVIERMRYELFTELDRETLENDRVDHDGNETHELYEQHCYLDLDDDGYEEPYVVTILSKSQKALRVVPRYTAQSIIRNHKNKVICIKPIQFFTDFHFIPNPDGSYFSIGYGQLLYHANDAVNTLANQMINAGTLAHNPTGFIDQSVAARLPGGSIETQMGKIVKLQTSGMAPIRDSIHLLEYPPPNPVMLSLMELIMGQSKELISLNDPTLGSAQVQNVTNAVMQSQLDNSNKVRENVYDRLIRSLQSVFQKYFDWNAIILPEQTQFLIPGKNVPISSEDYRNAAIRIKPVANARVSSDGKRKQQSQVLMDLAHDPATGGVINAFGLAMMIAENEGIENPQNVIQAPDPNPPQVIELQSEIAHKKAQTDNESLKLSLQAKDAETREFLAMHEARKMESERMLNEARAYAESMRPHIESKKLDHEAFMTGMKGELDLQKEKLKADSKPKPTSTGADK